MGASVLPFRDPHQHNQTVRDLFGPDAQGIGPDGVSQANQVIEANPPEDEDVQPVEQLRGLMEALYGSDFPLLNALDALTSQDGYQWTGEMPDLGELLPLCRPDEWASWVKGRWSLHRAAVEMHLYLVARNRLFRAGQHWVSSKNREPWRTPARPAEEARVVHNLIGPALDQRVQVIGDQRPGFDVEAESTAPDAKRKAIGRQQGLEYQYDQQNMQQQTRVAAYWAGTDGVAFWHTFWDPMAGPLDKRMGTEVRPKPLGDLRTETLRVEQWRVSANATAIEKPYYGIVRQVLPETEAASLYGAAAIQTSATAGDLPGNGDNTTSGTGADGIMPSWVLTQTIVGEGYRLTNIKTVERFTIYVEKHSEILPDGLQMVVVGNAVVWGPGELLFGCIPVARVADGSTDPSYYPRPIMEQWIPANMRINAAESLWTNSIRVNSGGTLIARPDAISRETFVGSGRSLMEFEGSGPISDSVVPMEGFSVGQDVKDYIALQLKFFEDMSGYNDVSRGAVSNETATAVAVANEQLQRIFAPPVEAVAMSFTDWSKVQLCGMAWGYDIPRDLGAVGANRPDLARALSSRDFDGPASVYVSPEKMMPTPKMYRRAQLDQWLAGGLITREQYMRNVEMANLKGLNSPDEDQDARAKRVCDALRLSVPPDQVPPIRWQTNEAIEQNALEREILLQDDLPPEVIAAADQRWFALAAQAAQKQALLAPPMVPPGAPGDPTQPGSPQLSPPTDVPSMGGAAPPAGAGLPPIAPSMQ